MIHNIIFFPFTTTATGTIGVTVDWTFDTSDLDVFLARGNDPCSLEAFNSGTCEWLAFSVSTTAKPETLSVPNLAAGDYTLYVGNFSDVQESFSTEITLTSVPGATASSMPGRSSGSIKGHANGVISVR